MKKILFAILLSFLSSTAFSYNYEAVEPFTWKVSHYDDLNFDYTNVNVFSVQTSNENLTVQLHPTKHAYYRFEVAEFFLSGVEKDRAKLIVMQDGKELSPFLADSSSLILHQTNENDLHAYWFYKWQTPAGTYDIHLYVDDIWVTNFSFDYIKRPQLSFNRSMIAVNLESNTPTYTSTINGPDFSDQNFVTALTNWMVYGGIDTFLNLSGETTGWNGATPEDPWEYYSLVNLERFGTAVHSLGKKVGGYIMCFYTPEDGWSDAGYEPCKTLSLSNTYNLESGKFISFKDEKRFTDVMTLASNLNSYYYVDMIGFDFIRFGEDSGYENADRFVKQMNIIVPAVWEYYSEDQKALWLGKQLEIVEDSTISMQWNLWKAHMTSSFIYRVRKTAGLTKPTWCFTLGWNHGTQHGQDPIMMLDAGVLMDGVMMYEATAAMYSSMSSQWSTYLAKERQNFFPGNQLDAVIMDSSFGYNVIEEYTRRLTNAVDMPSYGARGVFIHDMLRAFWGRMGDYDYYEWLFAGLTSASYCRYRNNEIPYSLLIGEITTNESGVAEIPVNISFVSADLPFIAGQSFELEAQGKILLQKFDITAETNIIISADAAKASADGLFLGLKGEVQGYPPYFTFKFFGFESNSQTN